MNYNNEKISLVYAKEGMTKFLSFLNENCGKSIVLVAHIMAMSLMTNI